MTRTDLSESARTLLEVTRDVYEPSAANRAHVRWRVDHALASGSAMVARRSTRRLARIVSLSAAAVVAVGAAAALTWQGGRSAKPPATVATPSEAVAPQPTGRKLSAPGHATETPTTEDGDGAQPEATAHPRSSGPRRARAASRAVKTERGDLSGEIALIARAQSATNRGEAEKALTALKEYDRKHPGGKLAEERSAARILALCAAGRRKEARAAAARFLARWPRSPQTARIHSSCAR